MTKTNGIRYSKTPQAAASDSRMTKMDLQVLAILGRHIGPDGSCYRNQKLIAEELGYDRRSVRRSLKRIEAYGYITAHLQTWPNGARKFSTYIVHLQSKQERLFDDLPVQRKVSSSPPLEDSPGPRPRTDNSPVPRTGGVRGNRNDPISNDPISNEEHGTEPHCAAARARRSTIHQDPDEGSNCREELEQVLRDAAGDAIDERHRAFQNLAEPLAWIETGCDLHLDILPTIIGIAARTTDAKIVTWRYFSEAVLEARNRRLAMASTNVIPFNAATR